MKPLAIKTAAELRQVWKEYWAAKGHTVVESSSLIPTHPSAPLFTNAGMIQFVPYFLGEEKPPFSPPRATSIQKCVRAGGKHNDLDAIGRSLRHLSFFEMLGNFSFGDYFKHEAIAWAWEFATETLGLDGDRIWVTIHVSDDEAEEIWHKEVGLPRNRIQRLEKDNFWEMGETGPCGPSSELFYDFGPEHGPDGGPANPDADSRFIEFWNLVFMQYFRDASGNLTPLPNRHVDTGAGLERIVGLLRGSPSLFECDTLSRLVAEVENLTHRKLGQNEEDDVALRLIADHCRSMTFLIADGVIPSNEDRGYVLRRIIRRAIRFAYLLGAEIRITPAMADHVIDVMGDVYPEIAAGRDLIVRILDREEEQFSKTLQTGLSILETELAKLPEHGGVLPGDVAFTLHDTYGFPLEVTMEIVADRGVSVDTDTFARHMADQRARGRAAKKRSGVDDRHNEYQRLLETFGPTEFTGRAEYVSDAHVIAVLPAKEGSEVFLDRTPFYAEQGGQVGDTGVMVRKRDGAQFKVTDTVNAVPGLHLHKVAGGLRDERLAAGDEVTASIDVPRREAIRRNHTGTHLLHWALREVLGTHVKQQGSLVAPDRLRFDFSHFEPVTREQLEAAENLVNREILSNGGVRNYETTQEEALAKGAIAFFGEKYGERVRVLEAGNHSIELCGGTHVQALGQIGSLKIISEGSIGSNLRRIEAVTGMGTIDFLRRTEQDLMQVADEAGVPVSQVVSGVHKRLADLRRLQAENRQMQQRLERATIQELVAEADDGVLVTQVELADVDTLRRLAVQLAKKAGLKAAVLGTVTTAGKPAVAAAVGPESGLDAGEILEPVSQVIGGGHGRQHDVAVAGGRDASRLTSALDELRTLLSENRLQRP
jgi:alanyl-tRNA synthetase